MDSGALQDAATGTLRILLLAGSDVDAASIERALSEAGFVYVLRRVSSEAGFRAELANGPDLVVSDIDLPGLKGTRALELAREDHPEVPFILLSRTISDELRRRAARLGASDVLAKDRLSGLGSAINAVLRMEEMRKSAREAEARFLHTFNQAAVGIAHTTTEGRILDANKKLCELFGYAREELVGLSTSDLTYPEDHGTQDRLRQEVIAGARSHFRGEKRYVSKSGEVIWVNRTVTLAREAAGGVPYLIQVFEDVTERKRTEARLERVSRARRVRAESSRLQVHAKSEAELLEGMCRVIVESGGYRQGWIGLATGDAARPLRVAAHAGYGDDMPLTPPAGFGPEVLRHGVAFRAFASGQTVILRDVLKRAGPADEWRRARAWRHGFQSSIALPLAAEGRLLGVLVTHAGEPDAFDEEELGLLKDMADDVAFGIATLRMRVARRDAEDALRASERRFRDIFNQAAVGITRVDLNGVLVDVNQKFCDMLGYARQELIGKHIRDITHPDDFGRGAMFRAQIIRGESKSASGEKRFVRKDGSILWARRTMSAAHDDAGEPQYVISVVEDITERKELETRFELTFNKAGVGMTQIALDGRYMQVNQKFAEMLGYSAPELMGMTPVQVTHPDDRAEIALLREKLLKSEIGSAVSEKRYIHRSGSVIWAKRTISLARNAVAEPVYFISVVEDITERKRAEHELQRKTDLAQLLESLARAANEAASPEATMRTCLDQICEHGAWAIGRLGIYGPGAGERFPERSLWHAREPARYEALMDASLDPKYFAAGGRFISVVLKEKRPVWIADIRETKGFGRMTVALACNLRSAFAFPVIVGGEVVAFLEFFAEEPKEPDALLLEAVTSVSAQLARLIERSRAMAETAQLASIVESSQDAMISVALDGTVNTWNAGAERMFGYSSAEAVGRNVSFLTGEDRRHEIGQMRMEALAGRAVAPRDTERLAKEGRRVQVSLSASPTRDSAGNITGVALIYRDIADRKRAEEAIARERALLRTIIDTLPDYVYVKDREGRFLLGNRAWIEARGTTNETIVGKTVFDIFARDVAEKMAAQDAAIVQGGAPLLDQEQLVVVKTPDGSRSEMRWSATTKVPMRDASGSIIGTVGISRDITERTLSARRRSMEHAVTRVLAESATVDEAIPRLLRTIGEAMGWAYGARWSWSAQENTLVRREHWSDFPVEFEHGEEVAWLRLQSLDSAGLLRRAWVEKAPTWIVDVERDRSLRRRASALKMGLRSAYSFPILDGRDVIGVMEFFGRDVRQPDGMLLQITGSIGRQIGQFIQRKQAEQRLRASEEVFRVTFSQANVGITISALDLRYLEVNDKYCEIMGYSRDELLRMSVRDVNPPGEIDGVVEFRKKLAAGEAGTVYREKQLVRKDGTLVWVSLVTSVVRAENGEPRHFISVVQDASERKRAEAALQQSEEQFRQLANNIPQAFWITDVSQKRTLYLSPAAQTLLGYPTAEILSNPRLLIRTVHDEDRYRVYAARKSAAEGGYNETYRIVRPDGSVRWVHDRAFPVRDKQGNVYRIAGIAEDITARKLAEERLMHLAHYDLLTSLPNRILFYDRLKQALAQAKRNHWIMGVMFIDVDRFKNINDTLGHPVGDKLLQQVSERLTRSVRSGDTVGRLGGDEFAVVLSNLSGAQDANMVAQKILAGFKEPFRLEGAELYVTASIGITLYPDDSTEQDTLIKNADTAMYRAKEIGRDCYQFYTPQMNARALEFLGMESSLRRALDRGEFLLHYQPKASVAQGEIVGVEALLRWRHPERGLVAPGEFMPVLEETGLIVPVGEWVVRTVCGQIKRWEAAGIRPVPVAVNISARQFAAADFGPTIRRVLEERRVDPSMIELEITESSLMTNTEEAVRALEYLEKLGVGLSIDDFGTGYSSLGYLKRFPLDSLKVDRSFVRDITSDGDDATITRAVISMAHSLGLKVIGEGVETELQLAFLAEYGCDEVQGYYFARPMEAEECGRWVQEDRRMRRPHQPVDSGAPTVLLVDDDEDALTLLRRGLAKDGYRILLARSAHEALNLLGVHRVDVIITDQNMPGMTGTEFLQRVKSLHPGTIRMITSAYADFKMMADAVNKGEVARFLPKSLSEEQLRDDVREALQSRSRSMPPMAA